MSIVSITMWVLRALILGRATIVAENVDLHQQLIVLQRSVKRPRLQKRDRLFWVWLYRLWKDWRSCILIVGPGALEAEVHPEVRPLPA